MADRPRVVPLSVVQEVEHYVSVELRDADQASNRTPLDESGIWSLHALAAAVYAAGFDAGERTADEKARRADMRRRDRETTTKEPTP